MTYIPLEKIKASIGEEALQKLLQDFPGGRVYLHKNAIDRQERDRAIISAYNAGASREQLAVAFGVSLSTIDHIKNRAKHNI